MISAHAISECLLQITAALTICKADRMNQVNKEKPDHLPCYLINHIPLPLHLMLKCYVMLHNVM